MGRSGAYYFGPSPFDMLYYSSSRRRYRNADEDGQMSMLPAIFSYVFGDGAPNADAAARSINMAREIARASGGVLVAEQLAPACRAAYVPLRILVGF